MFNIYTPGARPEVETSSFPVPGAIKNELLISVLPNRSMIFISAFWLCSALKYWSVTLSFAGFGYTAKMELNEGGVCTDSFLSFVNFTCLEPKYWMPPQ